MLVEGDMLQEPSTQNVQDLLSWQKRGENAISGSLCQRNEGRRDVSTASVCGLHGKRSLHLRWSLSWKRRLVCGVVQIQYVLAKLPACRHLLLIQLQ